MLAPNNLNRIVFEGDTVWHSRKMRRLIFLMNSEKWGLMKEEVLVNRDRKQTIRLEISYPINSAEENKFIPESTLQFDKNVVIREN